MTDRKKLCEKKTKTLYNVSLFAVLGEAIALKQK